MKIPGFEAPHRSAMLSACLLCVGAGLSVACGSSGTLLGESAGAGGNAGRGGANNPAGGSGGSAGSNGPLAGGGGSAGSNGPLAGYGGTGGFDGPLAGNSGTGGFSGPLGGNGGTAGSGGGSSGSGECVKDADCPTSEAVCVYRISESCNAKGSCQFKPKGPTCDGIIAYCGCDGSEVGVACSDPPGYAVAPVIGPKGTTACK